MNTKNIILDNCDMLSLISKTEPNFYCVFIQPNGIVDTQECIDKLKLKCDDNDLMIEKTLLETYDDKQEASDRVMQFRGEWLDNFYVSCYRNSKFICENI